MNEEDSDVTNCVDSVEKELKKIGGGRTVYDNEGNHAYGIPNGAKSSDLAINPTVRVNTGGQIAEVKFKDYTVGELENLIQGGKADDITLPEKS